MHDDGCGSCELGRRAFLRDAAMAVAAAVTIGRPAGGQTRAYPLPAQDGATVDRESDVILMRWQGSVYAFSLACPHQNTALRWLGGSDMRFQCPKHKSKYRPDGTFIEGRATRGLDRFPIRREGERVLVDLDHLLRQTDDAAAWSAAVVRL
jgi:nitrite reductase/ring-hydroxylating ferredoxin subunit